MPRFKSFVLFAGMRTGSNFLEANLNALDGVTCYGEAFNPSFMGRKGQTELLGVSLDERDADPDVLLRRMRAEGGMWGFRFFHDHDARVEESILADPTCAKIILTRNPLESYISLLIARATNQWKLTDAKRLKSARVRFDAAGFEAHVSELQAFHLHLLKGLQATGQTAFYIDYEDSGDVQVLNGLAAYLRVTARLAAVDDTLKKQNPDDTESKVENVEEMHQALAQLDHFNLSRTPNFEPRRPPGIPTAVAAAGAPLLFLPVRSAPYNNVRAWLSEIGSAGLLDGFAQKTLRQWKRANATHRTFTVVRHPLLRAYVAFHEQIVSGRLSEYRRQLIRAYKASLPEVGEGFADIEAEREAFLVFLHFARLSAAGQTGARVDPNWASQTAVVQGFAGFHPPDLVIREDHLQDGLAYLAADLGVDAPTVRPETAYLAGLQRIVDPAVEAAAANAYARDYMGFGFGPYRP